MTPDVRRRQRKRVTMKALLRALAKASLVLLALSSPAATRAQSGGEGAEVRELAAGWERAWNAHDMKALAALVAEDVDLITVSGTRLRSRKEFEEDHAKSHRTVLRESVLTMNDPEVRFVRPDVAVAHVGWGITGVKGPGGEALRPQRGILTWVLERREGAWVIIASQNTAIREPAPGR